METPVQGRPNRETGLPPGVEVGPLGKRFVAFLINLSVPVIVSLALVLLLPSTTGALRLTLGAIGAVIMIGWLVVVWYTLAVRAASPGLRAMKLQVVGFLDGRPVGPARVFLRAFVFWALFITGIGLLIMLIMMLRHPRKQGWHDLAVTAVMIKERLLAPPVQPARAATGAQQDSPAQIGSSQPTTEQRTCGGAAQLCTRAGLRACWESGAPGSAAWHGAGELWGSVRRSRTAGVGGSLWRQRVCGAVSELAIWTAPIRVIAHSAALGRRTPFTWAAGRSDVTVTAGFSCRRIARVRGHAGVCGFTR